MLWIQNSGNLLLGVKDHGDALSPFSTEYSSYLTHYHTTLHFDALNIYSCGKHCEKRRYCLFQAISPFLTMFSTQYGTYFNFKCTLKCRLQSLQTTFKSAFRIKNCYFNLDPSKILSSGNGLNVFQYQLCERFAASVKKYYFKTDPDRLHHDFFPVVYFVSNSFISKYLDLPTCI